MMTTKTKLGTCACCDHDNMTLTLHSYGSVYKRGQERWLCRACEQTDTSYYDDHGSTEGAMLLPVLKTICWGINEVLEKMSQSR